LLCAVREGEWGSVGLNQAVEAALVAKGRLTKNGAWYEGRPVMVTRNDPDSQRTNSLLEGLFNLSAASPDTIRLYETYWTLHPRCRTLSSGRSQLGHK
jgi:hypothetical protein